MSNLDNKIQNVNELCDGKFISLYDLEYKNKLNDESQVMLCYNLLIWRFDNKYLAYEFYTGGIERG